MAVRSVWVIWMFFLSVPRIKTRDTRHKTRREWQRWWGFAIRVKWEGALYGNMVWLDWS